MQLSDLKKYFKKINNLALCMQDVYIPEVFHSIEEIKVIFLLSS